MRWSHVCLETIAYALPEETVSTSSLEARLAPMYRALHLERGHIETLTGIRERRWWPAQSTMSACATLAAHKALAESGVPATELGAVVYAGVCRDQLEPATACAVAASIGAGPDALIFDVSNACLGLLNAMVEVANRIELGQMRAGLIVASESSREIVEATIARLNDDPTLERYRLGLATMTGGSGAVAMVLTQLGFSDSEHRLVTAAAQSAPQHHRLCRWGPAKGLLGETPNVMSTDASGVLEHGVELGQRTWLHFLKTAGWRTEDVDRVICHQVGSGHRREVLSALNIDPSRDFSTYELLGNMGSVSVPITAARAAEAGFLRSGDRVAWLGIGSGLNSLMLGLHW